MSAVVHLAEVLFAMILVEGSPAMQSAAYVKQAIEGVS
jgi:hypothetical protein